MNACYLIASADCQIPLVAAQFARLRAMPTHLASVAELSFAGLPTHREPLIAIRFTHFDGLPAAQKFLLRQFVQNGSVLYVCAGLSPGACCSLPPFADGELRASVELTATAYHCAGAGVLPKAPHYEHAIGEFTIAAAETTERLRDAILLARHRDSISRPVILALACGVIFDLYPDASVLSASIVARLSDSGTLPAAVGAMIGTDGRLSGIVSRRETFSHFATVLEFPAVNHLRPMSLEQIATEAVLCGGNDVSDDSAVFNTLSQRQSGYHA